MIKNGVHLGCPVGEQSMLHGQPVAPEFLKRPTGVARVRIRRRNNDPINPRINDGLRARRRAAGGGTRLERDIERGAAGRMAVFHGVLDGVHLGVCQPSPPMPAATDDPAAPNQHRTDQWVW